MGLSARDIMNRLAQDSDVIKEVAGEDRKKLQNVLLSCMQDFHKACTDNGIVYFLAGGSALGAVRHKGFIPWDDDIDVLMLREDWERFKLLFSSMLGERYDLEAPNYHDKDTKNMWGKVYLKGTRLVEIQEINMPFEKGVFIDVFIYDHVSNNPLIRRFDAFITRFLNGVAGSQLLYKYPNNLIHEFYAGDKKSYIYYNARRMLGFLFSFIPHKSLCNWIDRLQSRHHGTNIVTSPAGRGGYLGEMMSLEDLVPPVLAPFENYEFYIAKNVTKHLKLLYGDNYMQLPPEDKRERHFVCELKL